MTDGLLWVSAEREEKKAVKQASLQNHQYFPLKVLSVSVTLHLYKEVVRHFLGLEMSFVLTFKTVKVAQATILLVLR